MTRLVPLVIANWKMNPPSARAAAALFAAVALRVGQRSVRVAIAPPFPYLALFRRRKGGVTLAAQDVFWASAGAYTGEVSPAMLKDLGVRYVIVGHSERRCIIGESDEIVQRKVRAVLAAGLVPVIAVGEAERESQEVIPTVLRDQLTSALEGIPHRHVSRIVIAYEPIWAISTIPGAKADTPDNATRRAIYIRKLLTKLVSAAAAARIPILYGGSVNAKNAAGFIARDIRGMDGLLVGNASLNADEFVRIVRAVAGARPDR